MTNGKSNSGRRDSLQHLSTLSASQTQVFRLQHHPSSQPRFHTSFLTYPRWPTRGSQISGFWPPMGACLSHVYLTAEWQLSTLAQLGHSVSAGFSNAPLSALSTSHIPTNYSQGWPPTMEERTTRRQCGETTPTPSLPAPRSPFYESAHLPVLFCISPPRQDLGKGLVSTRWTHQPLARRPDCSFLSICRPASHSRAHSLGPGLTRFPTRQMAHAPLRRKPK